MRVTGSVQTWCWSRAVAASIVWLSWTTALSAHGAEEHSLTAPGAFSVFDLAVMAVLASMGVLYVAGSVRLTKRGVAPRRVERVAFACGWLALVAAVLPPFDSLGVELFSMHMAQHELMMLVGAPLIVAARPMPVWLWGVPDRRRPLVASVLQSRGASGGWRWVTTPLVAWGLHGVTIWIWHIPSLYDMAVENEAIHAVQHLMFVATAAFFWWGLVYGRYGRAGYGAAVFYVFTTVVHTGLLGAMLTLAGVPLFPVYLAPAAARGIDPLVDQQLAGLVMWIPAGVLLTLFGLALFAAWMGESERRVRATASDAGRVGGVLVLLIAAAFVSGCNVPRGRDREARELTGGDPGSGAKAIHQYGCDSCHTIPGIRTAQANVGPPLSRLGVRTYLAGRLENTPENLVRWIRLPHSVDPQTAMPETGVTERDGRNIAAYLYTLR
jgi:putative membrane protein